MMTAAPSRWLGLGVFAATLAFAVSAWADLDGQQACLDRESGSSCTRSSGDIGTCVAEPTLPGVLTCATQSGAGGSGVGGSGGGGQTSVGTAGYTGTGTGAQGGSVDGPACSVSSRGGGESQGSALVGLSLVGTALVLGRRRG